MRKAGKYSKKLYVKIFNALLHRMSQCSTAKFCQHIFILKQKTTLGQRIY